MAVPDFQTLMRPLLALAEDGEPHAIADLRGSLAEQFELSEEDLAAELLDRVREQSWQFFEEPQPGARSASDPDRAKLIGLRVDGRP